MTIPLVSIVFILAGGLVYALASGKLAELGRILLFVGLLVLGLALAGKGVQLAALIGEGTAHAQGRSPEEILAGEPDPDPDPAADVAPDDDVPEPTADDPASPVDQGIPSVEDVASTFRSGRWMAGIGLLLTLLVFLFRKYGAKLLGERAAAWVATDRGGIFVSVSLGVLAAIGTDMGAGRPPSLEAVFAGLVAAMTGSGAYVMGRRIMQPVGAGGAVVPPPEPEPEPKKRAKRSSTSAEG